MEWTIEKVRQLPEDNWLEIKRVGTHAWQIGDKPRMLTGDGGVLEYIKVLFETLNTPVVEEITNYPAEPSNTEYKKLTDTELSKIIGDALFGKDEKS